MPYALIFYLIELKIFISENQFDPIETLCHVYLHIIFIIFNNNLFVYSELRGQNSRSNRLHGQTPTLKFIPLRWVKSI